MKLGEKNERIRKFDIVPNIFLMSGRFVKCAHLYRGFKSRMQFITEILKIGDNVIIRKKSFQKANLNDLSSNTMSILLNEYLLAFDFSF